MGHFWRILSERVKDSDLCTKSTLWLTYPDIVSLTDFAPAILAFFLLIIHVCMCVESLSNVWLFETSWTVTHQASLSMGFPRQEYWSGVPFPTLGDLSEIEPKSLASPALAGRFFAPVPPGEPHWLNKYTKLLPHLGLLRFLSLSPAPVSYLQMCASVGILGLSIQPEIPVRFWRHFQSHHPVFYFFVAYCSFSYVRSMKTGTISFWLVDMPTTLRTVLWNEVGAPPILVK